MSLNCDLTEVHVMKYINYTLKFVLVNDTKMYFVGDILKQYSKDHNGIRKDFYKYIHLQSTRDLLNVLYKHKYNSDLRCMDKCENLLEIPEIIQKYKLNVDLFGTGNSAIIICEYLLIDCLMWVDKIFAYDVYSFLSKCREIDNEFLKNDLRGLIYANNEMTSLIIKILSCRYIQDKSQNNWILNIKPVIDENNNCIDLCIVYRKSEKTELDKNSLISISKIPNANVLRSILFPSLLELLKHSCKRKNKQRSCINVPLTVYTTQKFIYEHKSINNILTIFKTNPIMIDINLELYTKIKNIVVSIITALQWSVCDIKYLK